MISKQRPLAHDGSLLHPLPLRTLSLLHSIALNHFPVVDACRTRVVRIIAPDPEWQ